VKQRTLIGLSLGVFFLLLVAQRKRAVTRHGIELSEDGPTIVDWGAWMAWGPRAVKDAFFDGALSGDQVLSHVMRRAFPEVAWPPEPQSPYVERWREMVHGLNRALQEPEDDVDTNVIPLRR